MSKKRDIDSNQFVVKSNTLVEARYRLSLQESHVVLWLLTQIKADDEDLKTHQLKVEDFAKMVGVKADSRYSELRQITKRLMQRVMEIFCPQEDKIIQVAWLSAASYTQKKGIVSLEFSPQLKPYLLQLKSQFTKINIADAMGFKSIYAIRIFELLLQYEAIGNRTMSIAELREWCGIEKDEYELYGHLKSKVLNPTRKEINEKTQYETNYTEIKESRKVVAIEWSFQRKTHFEKRQREKAVIIEKELRSNSAILEQLLEYGFTKQAANRLIKKHEETDIANAIKAVDIYMAKNTIKNPKALIETAIKEKWHPERYAVKKKSAQSSLPL